ncbi:MAG: hypothetical protein M0Z95_20700 [Actinomycetota bacterium]|nr:hypothetical protein [Actinomycetota bacterium]
MGGSSTGQHRRRVTSACSTRRSRDTVATVLVVIDHLPRGLRELLDAHRVLVSRRCRLGRVFDFVVIDVVIVIGDVGSAGGRATSGLWRLPVCGAFGKANGERVTDPDIAAALVNEGLKDAESAPLPGRM